MKLIRLLFLCSAMVAMNAAAAEVAAVDATEDAVLKDAKDVSASWKQSDEQHDVNPDLLNLVEKNLNKILTRNMYATYDTQKKVSMCDQMIDDIDREITLLSSCDQLNSRVGSLLERAGRLKADIQQLKQKALEPEVKPLKKVASVTKILAKADKKTAQFNKFLVGGFIVALAATVLAYYFYYGKTFVN